MQSLICSVVDSCFVERNLVSLWRSGSEGFEWAALIEGEHVSCSKILKSHDSLTCTIGGTNRLGI
jgi:hypothetical protein